MYYFGGRAFLGNPYTVLLQKSLRAELHVANVHCRPTLKFTLWLFTCRWCRPICCVGFFEVQRYCKFFSFTLDHFVCIKNLFTGWLQKWRHLIPMYNSIKAYWKTASDRLEFFIKFEQSRSQEFHCWRIQCGVKRTNEWPKATSGGGENFGIFLGGCF